jgi:hypothetical protein
MIRFPFIVSLGLLYSSASAQAQVVQLPTFHQFSTSTTVVVPDRGSTSLAGVGRSAAGGSQFGAPGLPGNRSTGAAAQAGGVGLLAQIHDFAEMDRRLLEQAANMRGPLPAMNSVERVSAEPVVASISEIKRAQSLAVEQAEKEAFTLLRRADVAYEAGKHRVAKVYYEMTIRRAEGSALNTALTKLEHCKQALHSQRRR